MRIVIAGSNGFRGVITDQEFADTDWGSSSDDFIRFNTEAGDLVVINLATVGSISFGSPTSPPGGSYDIWRISARGPGGGVDCLIDDTNKDIITTALSQPGYQTTIVEFTSLYGIVNRLIIANLARLLIVPEVASIPGP
jgi:hypothetical protein